jgi:peptidoglycan/LPS O-acetylase OafA/YrhL
MDTVVDHIPIQATTVTSKDNERRIAYIDTLRGLASIQVLLSHSMLAFFAGTALASPSSGTLAGYLAASPLYFAIDGASAVCIFFVLSGYVLTPIFTYSHATNSRLIGSRFLRLGIPAIASCAFSAILFQALGGYNEVASTITKSQWLAEGWRPSSDLWFVKDALINGIILGYQDSSLALWLGFPVAYLAPMENSYVTPLWTLSIEFYGSILILLLARSRSRTMLILAILLLSRTYLLCFVAGHLAARFDLGGKRLIFNWPTAMLAAVIGLAVCLTSHFWTPEVMVKFCSQSMRFLPPCPLAKTSYLMRVYGATIFTIGVMQCAPLRRFLAHERLQALGRLSFPIYLTHWPIIFGIGSVSVIILAPWTGPIPARLMALAISIALSIFTATFFEPIDQAALRVSRAWRKRSVTGDTAQGKSLVNPGATS